MNFKQIETLVDKVTPKMGQFSLCLGDYYSVVN